MEKSLLVLTYVAQLIEASDAVAVEFSVTIVDVATPL